MKIVFSLFLVFFLFATDATAIGDKCLPGYNHKKTPGPEGPKYKACHIFKDKTCCTANFTNQLIVPVIQKIGSFSWTLCGNLSKKCQDFMVGVECFYRCSPNVAHWEKKNEQQAFHNAPVCSHYCDAWFDACRDDKTCAKNWKTDFELTENWANSCKNTSKCQTYQQVYGNGQELCENMWGDSFKYIKPNGGPCLHFNFSGTTNPNNVVVIQIFGGGATPTSLHIMALVTLVVASMFFD